MGPLPPRRLAPASPVSAGRHAAPRPSLARAAVQKPDPPLSADPPRRAALLAATSAAALAAARAARAAIAPNPATRGAPSVDDGGAARAATFAATLEARVAQFTLPNGITFVVLDRGAGSGANPPVVSCVTHAAVGAFDESDGETGMAHLLEHMAFKGTADVGGGSAREAALLDAADAAFAELRAKIAAGAPKAAVAAAAAALDAAAAAADAVATPNEYGATLTRAGALGLNAATSHDATKYYCSLPSSALELWFALEAARFQAPVFRGLYTEKKVVAEERRSRVNGAPLAAFQQRFLRTALANNYGRPVIGYAGDVDAIGRPQLARFFTAHYGPPSLTIAVVGDAPPSRVRTLAERYFGAWDPPTPPLPRVTGAGARPARPAVAPARAITAERGGPLILQAYYRPADDDASAPAIDIAADILASGRSGRLYRALVEPGLALAVGAAAAVPGDLRPCAALLQAVPTPGIPLDRVDAALAGAALRLAGDGATSAELARAKKGARLSLADRARSNGAMAALLAAVAGDRGTWKGVLADLRDIEALTPADVETAAGAVFAADGNAATAWALPAAERVDVGDVSIA